MADLQEVLRLVNAGRAVFGLEPIDDLPMGSKGEPLLCPIGKAFEGNVHMGGMIMVLDDGTKLNALALAIGSFPKNDNTTILDTPAILNTFEQDFDKGLYPQYDLFPGKGIHK